MSELEKIKLISQPTKKLLEKRQLEDYLSYQEQLAKWLLNLGKEPKKAEGYSRETVKRSIYHIDSFHRFIWKKLEEKYTLNVKTSHADEYMKHIAYQDFENSYKHSVQKSLKRYFKYKEKEQGEQEWTPEMSFYESTTQSNPRDFLTREERAKIREAAFEYGSIPSYNSLNAMERDKWKSYLKQRFEKSKSQITREDWEKANGWKITSLI